MMLIEGATMADFQAIRDRLDAYWDGRPVDALHHPLLIHEFGETAFVARSNGMVAAYLFGMVTATGVGYVHVMAVHRDHRRLGLARRLHDEFVAVAGGLGARTIRAIARPENAASIAFHRRASMTATEVVDHSGPGQTRIVVERSLL